MGETASIITASGLSFAFNDGPVKRNVLNDVNLDIFPGEIVILTGPSGSGKTTLLTLIGALRTAQHGSLKVLGSELVDAAAEKLVKVRRKIGFIFQAHNLLRFLTAHQNVRMALELDDSLENGEVDRRAARMLDAVGLSEHGNKFPENLSGGQKQRVAIARALVGEPRLVLADEPTASLDKTSGREVVELMHRLAKRTRCAILLVTHDNRILDIADRIIHMEDGRLVTNNQGINASVPR